MLKHRTQALEVLVAGKVDRDLAPALGRLLDLHLGAQGKPQLLFHVTNVLPRLNRGWPAVSLGIND